MLIPYFRNIYISQLCIYNVVNHLPECSLPLEKVVQNARETTSLPPEVVGTGTCYPRLMMTRGPFELHVKKRVATPNSPTQMRVLIVEFRHYASPIRSELYRELCSKSTWINPQKRLEMEIWRLTRAGPMISSASGALRPETMWPNTTSLRFVKLINTLAQAAMP